MPRAIRFGVFPRLASILVLALAFAGTTWAAGPDIRRVLPMALPDGGVRLEIHTANAGPDAILDFGGQLLRMNPVPAAAGVFWVDIPRVEPGFLEVRVRSDGLISDPARVQIGSGQTLSGWAFYQKAEVTDNGLELDRITMVPVRNARVEVVDKTTQRVLSVSATNDVGRFQVLVPSAAYNPLLLVRVVSRLRSQEMRVLDNTQGNPQTYSISTEVDMRDPDVGSTPLELYDRTRVSGAFNILEVLQRANELVQSVNSRFVGPPVTVYWSPRNTNRVGNLRDGFIGRTFFDLALKVAFILGDRMTDSDEFDDSVILHEYAHMLAERFSRDDSPGGSHALGDLLDPRVAWSEGWANFFSAAVRNSPIYRDSKGPVGALGVRYDLEDNVPVGDRPGYRSEASVASLLWDLVDEGADAGDAARFPFAAVWAAFIDLQNQRFVYFPYFLDGFRARNPEFSDELVAMAQVRSIDFMPGVDPSVTMPFPQAIKIGQRVSGAVVDSLTTRRANLAQSAHFFTFKLTAPSIVMVDLQVDTVPGGDANFNDLDLFLMDANGNRIAQSYRGLNGQPEWIETVLAPGTYFVEVRSFFIRPETNTLVFNSGTYNLQVQVR